MRLVSPVLIGVHERRRGVAVPLAELSGDQRNHCRDWTKTCGPARRVVARRTASIGRVERVVVDMVAGRELRWIDAINRSRGRIEPAGRGEVLAGNLTDVTG